MLSQMVQRAMIEIDEEGAEAAATTAVMSSRALGADDAIQVVMESPSSRHCETSDIVAGQVGQPPTRMTA
jgi:serine protease inhibitor